MRKISVELNKIRLKNFRLKVLQGPYREAKIVTIGKIFHAESLYEKFFP